MQFLEDVETGLTGDMHVEQDAGWRPGSCNRQQRSTVCKTNDLIASCRQDHRKRVANSRVVIDYENLPAGGDFFSHVPSPMRSGK